MLICGAIMDVSKIDHFFTSREHLSVAMAKSWGLAASEASSVILVAQDPLQATQRSGSMLLGFRTCRSYEQRRAFLMVLLVINTDTQSIPACEAGETRWHPRRVVVRLPPLSMQSRVLTMLGQTGQILRRAVGLRPTNPIP